MIYGVLLDITKVHVGAYFALYGQIEEVACVLRKVDVLSGDFAIQVILDRKNFQEITDTLVCRGKRIFVVVVLVVWRHQSLGKNVSQPKFNTSAS